MNNFKPSTDWGHCCLCQQEKHEKLPQPNFKQETNGYKTLQTNIEILQSLFALPIPINPTRLDNGTGVENTLSQNQAKYHSSCYLLFNNTQVDRAKERREKKSAFQSADERSTKRVKRTNINTKDNVCFICENEDDRPNLRQVETVQTCENLKEFAHTLNDTKLLANSSGPDAIAQEIKYHPACYKTLQNKVRSLLNAKNKEQDEQLHNSSYAVAFSELLSYIY